MVNRVAFVKWWPIVMKLWRQSGRTSSILESDLRALYDEGLSPLNANDRLIARDRARKQEPKEPPHA